MNLINKGFEAALRNDRYGEISTEAAYLCAFYFASDNCCENHRPFQGDRARSFLYHFFSFFFSIALIFIFILFIYLFILEYLSFSLDLFGSFFQSLIESKETPGEKKKKKKLLHSSNLYLFFFFFLITPFGINHKRKDFRFFQIHLFFLKKKPPNTLLSFLSSEQVGGRACWG